jgi:hypothetical protein
MSPGSTVVSTLELEQMGVRLAAEAKKLRRFGVQPRTAADYVNFSYHFPASRTLLSTIEIKVFYLVPHKDGRIEVSEGDPESQVCEHTVFSHAGICPAGEPSTGSG